MDDYSPVVYYYEKSDLSEVRVVLIKHRVEFISFCLDKELINGILNILNSKMGTFGNFQFRKIRMYVDRHIIIFRANDQFKASVGITDALHKLLIEAGQFLNESGKIKKNVVK